MAHRFQWLIFGLALACTNGEPMVDDTDFDTDTDADTDTDTDTDTDADTDVEPSCADEGPVTVETSLGCVIGRSWGTAEAFLGIPYAQPPVDALRWEEPVPAEAWEEPFEAFTFGSACVQAKDMPLNGVSAGDGDEDCLYLNVFRPEGAAPGDDYPILFFTHGGSYETGDGHGDLYTKEPMLANDAILVTHNYRLGPFGFMAHGDGLGGNQGLFDSLMALQWVVDNAESLGGDSKQLMVFGESAGAMTTCAFLTSPLTEDMFSAALLQSIGCGWLQTPKSYAEDQGLRMSEALGCTEGDVITCMRESSQQDVVQALGANENYFAIVDGRFVTKPVGVAVHEGDFHRVPIVAGVNRDEGTMFVHWFGISTDAELEQALNDWGTAYGITDLTMLNTLYSADRYGTPQRAFDQFYGDMFFHCMTRYFLSNASAFTDTYAYYYTHEPSWIPYYPALEGWGAYHSAELTFVFGTNQDLLPAYEQAFSKELTQMWIQAARGAPQLPNGSSWPLFAKDGSWYTDGGQWIELRPGGYGQLGGVKKTQCDFIANQWWD